MEESLPEARWRNGLKPVMDWLTESHAAIFELVLGAGGHSSGPLQRQKQPMDNSFVKNDAVICFKKV
jgi:hypothetical protein